MQRHSFGKLLVAFLCGILAIVTIGLGLFFLPPFFEWQLTLAEGAWTGLTSIFPMHSNEHWVFVELNPHGKYLIIMTFYTSLWYAFLT